MWSGLTEISSGWHIFCRSDVSKGVQKERVQGGDGALEFLAFVAVYSPGTATSIIHFTNQFASHMVLGLNPFAT